MQQTYQQTLDYLYRQMPAYQRIGDAAYKPGLENTHKLDAIFGTPHHRFRTIHVGGTNGKGSTSHLLAAVLQEAGYKTGLYTSPHLLDFRERIRINGTMIEESYVIDFVEKYRKQFEPVVPSFFELTMEMAFLWFAEQKVDVAVIEVGLGGRLDSTNVLSPDVSIITNIGFDHMQYLGNTLPKIAAEKAGIIKPGTLAIIGEAGDKAVKQIFIDKATSVKAPLLFAETECSGYHTEKKGGVLYIRSAEFPKLISGLGGPAQEKNSRTVLIALRQLRHMGYAIPDEAIKEGFRRVKELTGLMGRWQLLQANPKIICDIAHNAHGIRYVAEQLRSEPYRRLHIVFGMANDKDVDAVLSLLPKRACYYFTRAAVERSMPEERLALQAKKYGLHGVTCAIVPTAIRTAQKNADENDLIFIGGSAFVVAETLPLFL